MNCIKVEQIDPVAYEAMHGFATTATHRVSAGFKEVDQLGGRHFSGDFYFRFRESANGGLYGYITFPQNVEAHFKGAVSGLERLLKQCGTGDQVLGDSRWTFFW